jgi:hypothetical protein
MLGTNNAFSFTVSLDTDYILAARFNNDADTVEGYVNGTRYLNNTSATGDLSAATPLYVGRNYGGMNNKEIIVFDRALTDAEMNQMGQYLSEKWGPAWAGI